MTKHMGKNIEDIPLPHRYKWPESEEPRGVKVRVYSWKDYIGGAIHWYAEIQEDRNPIWDSSLDKWAGGKKVMGWTECWDHPKEHKGRHFQKQFLSKTVAKGWVKDIWKEHFNDGEGYQIRELYDKEFEWLYTREGD